MKKSKTTALLIVDLQKSFEPSQKMIDSILKISKNYNTVLATQFIEGNHLFKKIRNRKIHSNEELSLCNLPKNSIIFQKTSYGLPPKLINYLKKKKIEKVDICGHQTESCVLASAFYLWDIGIEPNILKELVSTKKKNLHYHKAAFLIFEKNF